MTTSTIAATLLCPIGAIHVYWAAGGRLGLDSTIPQQSGKPMFKPGPGLTLLVGLLLFSLAALVLWRDGVITLPLPYVIASFGVPLAALVFFARAVGDFKYVGWSKRVRGSRFARLDDVLFVPLCLTLAICFGVVGWS